MRRPILAASLAAALLLTSCGGEAASSPAEPVGPVTDLESLVEQAEDEGKLLMYTSLTESDLERLTTGFTEKYDIEVQALRLGGTDAATRFDTEVDDSAPSADLLVLADPIYIGDATSRGSLTPLEDTGLFELLDTVPEHLRAPEISSAIVQIVNSGIAYNTDNVSPEEVPSSWEDLLDPRWNQKLIGTTPESSMNNLVTWGQLYDSFGEDFVASIGNQVSRTYPNLVPLHESLAAGDGDIALQSAQFFVEAQKAQGKPVEFVNLQPSVYPVHALGISARANSPYAARLLAYHLMTKEGAATITQPEIGSFSAYDEDLIPEDFAVISTEKSSKYQGMKNEISAAFGG